MLDQKLFSLLDDEIPDIKERTIEAVRIPIQARGIQNSAIPGILPVDPPIASHPIC